MPGYLHHLATRLSATAPTVRPRLPSRFEPVRGVGPVEAGQAFWEMPEESPASTTGLLRDDLGQTQGPSATRKASDNSEMTLRPRITAQAAEVSPAAGNQETRSEPTLSPLLVRPAEKQTREQSAAPVVRKKDSLLPKEERTPSVLRGSRNTKSRGPESEEAESARDDSAVHKFEGSPLANLEKIARELLGRAPRAETANERASANSNKLLEEVSSIPETGFEAALAMAPTVTPSFAAPAEAQPFETPAPKQDIQIVIGKITVEGAAPATQAVLSPFARPAPKMTLEQYLRERESSR